MSLKIASKEDKCTTNDEYLKVVSLIKNQEDISGRVAVKKLFLRKGNGGKDEVSQIHKT